MGLNINNFSSNSSFNAEVPGIPVPTIGSPIRRCFINCQTCGKVGNHKGYYGYDMQGCTSYEKDSFFFNDYNYNCSVRQQIQAVLNLQRTHSDKICRWDTDAYKIEGDFVWKEYQCELISASGNTFVCQFDPETNSPYNITNGDYHFTLDSWGFATVSNSDLGNVHDGFQCQVYSINTSTNRITFYSHTPIDSGTLLMTKINQSLPLVFTFGFYWGKAYPIWSDERLLSAFWAKKETQEILKTNLIQGVNTIFTAQRIGMKERSVEKKVNGVYTKIDVPFKNKPSGGSSNVILDLTNIDFNESGLTAFRLSYWKEGIPYSTTPESIVWSNIDSPTAQGYTVATNKKQSGDYTLEFRVNGSDWHTWNYGTVSNVWNGSYYNVSWDITGSDMLYYPPRDTSGDPDPLPEDWTPPPDPDPIQIDGIRISFTAYGPADGDYQIIHGKTCGWNVDEYNQSVGLSGPSGSNCTRYCLMWGARTQEEKDNYYFDCMENCSDFTIDTNERESPSTSIAGLILPSPWEQRFTSNNPSGALYRVGPNGSLYSNTYTQIDATGLNWDRNLHMNGIGGWGGKVYSQYHAYDQEIQVQDLDEFGQPVLDENGNPTYHTETQPVYLNTVDLKSGIENFQTKSPLTSSPISLHRDRADWRGTPVGLKTEYRETTIVAPLIPDQTDWIQLDEGHKYRHINLDANLNEVDESAAVYFGELRMNNPILSPKDKTSRELPLITTVQFARNVSSGTIPLKNKNENIACPGGTGEPDIERGCSISGTNVLNPDQSKRLTNYAAGGSLVGEGDATRYIYAGMGLRIPDDVRIPVKFHHRILKILNPLSSNSDAGYIDSNWDATAQIIMNAPGLMNDWTNILKYLDTFEIEDEFNTLAEIGQIVDLTTLTFEVVQGVWCNTDENTSWIKSSPTDTDTTINGVLALPYSGRFYFPVSLKNKCLVGNQVSLISLSSYLSVSSDLAAIKSTLENTMSTPFSFSPTTVLGSDNRRYELTVNYNYINNNNQYSSSYQIVNGEGTQAGVGTMGNDYSDNSPFEFTTYYYNPASAINCGEIQRLFVGSSYISDAVANMTISASLHQFAWIATPQDDGTTVWDIQDNGNSYPQLGLCLFGITYTGNGPVYTNLGSTSINISSTGYYKAQNISDLARLYKANCNNFKGFILFPKTSDLTLPPGQIATQTFLMALHRMTLDRSLSFASNGAIQGHVYIKEINWSIDDNFGGVMTLDQSGIYLPSFARVPYRHPPANIKH